MAVFKFEYPVCEWFSLYMFGDPDRYE